MNYLNLPIRDLSSDEFIGSVPTDRSTWVCLMRYCAHHETGGRIVGVKQWGERKLIGLLSVLKAEIEKECPLWSWDGDDVVVWRYPVDQEKACQAKREAGLKYGKGHPKAEQEDGDSLADSLAKSIAMTKRKGKERKERERKVSIEYTADFLEFWQAYPKKVGKDAAFKAWEKASHKPPLPEIISSVEAHKKTPQWKKDGGDYIPHPATWLNQGRWSDEVTTIKEFVPDCYRKPSGVR